MEISKTKLNGKFYLRLRLDGRTLHETECHFDQVDWYVRKYLGLYETWSQLQSQAVLNRWATFQFICEQMKFPTETGAHAAIFSMVNYDAYS